MSLYRTKQAGIYRCIKLTAYQKKQLKCDTEKYIPNLLNIITVPYNDCTCGLMFYGLWSRKSEVQVAKSDLDDLDEIIEEGLIDDFKKLTEIPNYDQYRTLNIDPSGGNIFQYGKLVNNLNQALLAIETIKPDYGDGKSIYVNTPPIYFDAVSRETAKKTYTNLLSYFKSKGYRVFAFFQAQYISMQEQDLNNLPVYNSKSTSVKLSTISNGCILSCGTKWNMTASSTANWKDESYDVENLRDTMLSTSWVENVPGNGIDEFIIFSSFSNSSSNSIEIKGFIIANGFQKSKDLFLKNSRVKSIVLELNDTPLYLLELNDAMAYQEVSFPILKITKDDKIKLRIIDVYGGLKYQDTSISMLLPK